MRKRLYTIIHKAAPGDRLSQFYDMFIVAVAFISVTPLMFKGSHPALDAIDLVTVYILFADYIFRWICSDYSRNERLGEDAVLDGGAPLPATPKTGWQKALPFLIYPFTLYAIFNLVSLLPSMGLLGPGFRMLRMLRIFTIFHYSKNFRYIAHVFRKERKTLASVLVIALFYIFISALVMFSYEPDTFDSFFDAVYWATTALTTVGYGDVFPISAIGKLISMVSSLFGIAVIALPAGIVTAGFVDEINKNKENPQGAGGGAATPPPANALGGQGNLLRFTPMVRRYCVVITAGVLLNLGLNALAQALNLPLWLDVTGTAYAALLLEPAAGLVVGLVNNMLLAIFEFGTASLLYYAVSAAVALVAGLLLRKNGRFSPARVAPALLLVVLLSTLLSGSIDYWLSGGQAPATYWEHLFYTRAQSAGAGHLLSVYIGEGVVKTVDTLATAGVVALLYACTPKPWRRTAAKAK